ncbi:MAG: Holliday junction resolvase RuvX [Burkholderiales bacterium]|nr:Holliday junction resolvase RuvX [Burkholderiales bacterium]
MPEGGAGTVLAFDFGLQRIGVAVGEQATGIAHPLEPIRAARGAGRLDALARLVAQWSPSALVVGRPLSERGEPHALTRRAERFARQLAARFRLPVALVDERYSSLEAEARMRAAEGGRRAAALARARRLDSHAAAVILEQYFGERGR